MNSKRIKIIFITSQIQWIRNDFKLSTSSRWQWLCRFLGFFTNFWLLRFLDCSSKWFRSPCALAVFTCLRKILISKDKLITSLTLTVLEWMRRRELITNTAGSSLFNLFKHNSCHVIATSKTFLSKTLICFMWLNSFLYVTMYIYDRL